MMEFRLYYRNGLRADAQAEETCNLSMHFVMATTLSRRANIDGIFPSTEHDIVSLHYYIGVALKDRSEDDDGIAGTRVEYMYNLIAQYSLGFST